MNIAILLYDRFTALDAVGPYEVLSRLPGAEVTFVAKEAGPRTTDTGSLSLVAARPLAEVSEPEILLVPGGPGKTLPLEDAETLEWIRAADAAATWTTSVCTGALILGAAGLLDGLRATTHWAYMERLADYGATPVSERVVEDGKVVTAAGVSSGIDMALTLAAEIAGPEVAQAIQLSIEYDPDPPFDTGSPAKAPAAIVEFLREMST